jgi:hypothetical protein
MVIRLFRKIVVPLHTKTKRIEDMKQELFYAIRSIFKLQNTDYLEIEHNTFSNEQDIPTYDNWKISGVSISPLENSLRIFSENGNWLMFQDVNIDNFDEDALYDLYEELFDYFMSQEDWGTSQDFLENCI